MRLKDFFSRFTGLLPLWTVLACVLGFCLPSPFIVLRPGLDWLFFMTMLGIGAVMNFSDFGPLARRPHLVLLGVLAQFAIMPALGLALAGIMGFPPELTLGFVLVGAVPGAMASNVIAFLARTDTAYSIALTSTATLLSPVLTPALTYLYAHTIIDIPFVQMFFSIIKMVIAPLLLGLALRRYGGGFMSKWGPFFPALSTLCIAFICGLVIALNRDRVVHLSLLIFAAVVLHNFLGMMLGYGAGLAYRFEMKRRKTLAIEVGMQNAGLGAVLALKHFSAQAALVPAVFATWCVITASVAALIWRRSHAAGN
jgi:BASS family bile acid:Na+ symporter